MGTKTSLWIDLKYKLQEAMMRSALDEWNRDMELLITKKDTSRMKRNRVTAAFSQHLTKISNGKNSWVLT